MKRMKKYVFKYEGFYYYCNSWCDGFVQNKDDATEYSKQQTDKMQKEQYFRIGNHIYVFEEWSKRKLTTNFITLNSLPILKEV